MRVYDPDVDDFAASGYPLAWEWVKHQVRENAGHRCVRCGHPYVVGQASTMDEPSPELRAMMEEHEIPQCSMDLAMELLAEDEGMFVDPTIVRMAKRQHWSACDARCTHAGPIRLRLPPDMEWGREIEPALERVIPLLLDRECEVQAAWRILTVRHVNGDRADCRSANLRAICQQCAIIVL